ncbi:AraC family transcriptional regulator [Aliihoeflea sp. PC F10.4]
MDIRIIQAIAILERDMSTQVSFTAVAREVGLSAYRFHHLFAQEKKETPGGYLRRIRMDAACLRLRWTSETAGAIGFSLGYAEQAAFTRAFTEQFGMTPGRFRRDLVRWPRHVTRGHNSRRVSLRTVSTIRLLGKRFYGDYGAVRENWRSFLALLPDEVVASARHLHLGLIYDDPRFTPVHQLRYDCCVTIPDTDFGASEFCKEGVRIIETRPGRYASLEHRGPAEDVFDSYTYLSDHWLSSSNYSVTDDPAIELHPRPRPLMPRNDLVLNILFPVL